MIRLADGEVASPERESYARALVALDEAMLLANTDPEPGILALTRALNALHQFAPLLADDADARTRRTLGQLALARAKLIRGDERGAAASMDEALRELEEPTLATAGLGPSLTGLYEQRRAALEQLGRGQLRIECSSACRAYVDERALELREGVAEASLLVGSHRVLIVAEAGDREALLGTIELAREGTTLVYPEREVPPPKLATSEVEQRDLGVDASPTRRLAPRWSEVLLIGAGAAAVASGGLLWAIDSKCPGGVDPTNIEACPELYDTRTGGITAVVVGAAVLLTGVGLLTHDELRRERSTRVQLVGTSLRF